MANDSTYSLRGYVCECVWVLHVGVEAASGSTLSTGSGGSVQKVCVHVRVRVYV